MVGMGHDREPESVRVGVHGHRLEEGVADQRAIFFVHDVTPVGRQSDDLARIGFDGALAWMIERQARGAPGSGFRRGDDLGVFGHGDADMQGFFALW